MIRRLTVLGLLLILGVPAATLVIEHIRGRTRLGDLVREQEARGERLGIQHFIPPPVPPASNGMDALMLATPRLSANSSAFLPPAIRLVAPGRALVPEQYAPWPGPGNTPVDWDRLDGWMEDHAAPLELLHASLTPPVRQPSIRYDIGLLHLRLEHLSPIKTAFFTLSLSAAAHARHGDLEATLQDFAGMRALESDLATEPILISQLVRTACASIAGARLWAVAHDRPWSEPDLARLQAALPDPHLVRSTLLGMEGERALCFQELRRNPIALFETAWDEHGSELFGTGDDALRLPRSLEEATSLAATLATRLGHKFRSRILFPLWRFGWGDQAIAYYLETVESLLLAGREANTRQSAKAFAVDLLPRIHPPSPYDRLRAIYVRAVLPNAHLALLKAFRAETERALHETGLALRRHELRHGRLPGRLDELVPDFLPAVPIDRMDGQPLRYRRDADHAFTLWSVGDDGIDGQGDPAWTDPVNHAWWLGRDAVWPRPASPEEVASWKEAEAARLARLQGPGGSKGALDPALLRRYGLQPPDTSAPVPAPQPAPSPVP